MYSIKYDSYYSMTELNIASDGVSDTSISDKTEIEWK